MNTSSCMLPSNTFKYDPGKSVGGEEDAAPIPLPEAPINGMSEEVNTIKVLQGVVDIIDNDNEPSPENVPATADNSNRLLSTEWGHDGFCFRRSQNSGSSWAKLNFSVDATCRGYYIQLFKGFFPKQLLQNVIDIVNENMDGDEDVVYGEFIWWIGIWVLMSTVDGADQHSFWSTKNVNAFDGAPFRLTPFMSCGHFEKMFNNLGYTKEGPPQYQDHFWEVQTMLQMWNKNIAHFDNKDVGDIDAIKGTMDGVPFHIQSMKETDYIMMLMSTYGMTLKMGVTKRRHYTVEGVKKVVEFQYPEIVHTHYKFRDMIDNHNSLSIHSISMEVG